MSADNQPDTAGTAAIIVPDATSDGYWSAARDGRLVVQVCHSCGAQVSPPTGVCHKCHSTDVGWVDGPRTGSVVSWIVVHVPIFPHLRDDVPFAVVLVEWAGAGRLLARWAGDLAAVGAGPVELGIEQVNGHPAIIASPCHGT